MDLTTTAYGTWNGGRFMHFGLALDEDAYRGAIRHAYESGIRTFMTADTYGSGEADTMLGQALEGIPRDSYCLVGAVGHDFYKGKRFGAKGFPRFTDPRLRGEDEYGSYIKQAVADSARRCETDHFDMVMLHNPDSIGYTSQAVWDGMEAIKKDGLTEMLGLAPGPANGFTLDVLQCFEEQHERIDWAMLILNPLEPWPGRLPLDAAEKFDIKVVTRVVDHGGLFHDDVKPGHKFARNDHRQFRPVGWVEQGCEKIDAMRPTAEKHGLSMLHFACAWNLSHPAVKSVVPTIIQEMGGDARPISEKIAEFAQLNGKQLEKEECEAIAKIGDNTGCMPLKGGSRQYLGKPQADQWPVTEELEKVARQWNIDPDRDLYCPEDPRDLREKGMPKRGVPQATDCRLYVQLQVFTGIGRDGGSEQVVVDAVKASGLSAVVYANVNDPRGIGVLTLTEDPADFAGAGRDLFRGEAFADLELLPDMTMIGRTYGFGREDNIRHWMLRRPLETALNPEWPWAIWYPLRRKGSFYQLSKKEQSAILREHGTIGFHYGGAGYAGDVRLESFGLDRDDNEFVLGLHGPELTWLSKLIATMRPTVQTSRYMDKLGPFFVGKVIYRSEIPKVG